MPNEKQRRKKDGVNKGKKMQAMREKETRGDARTTKRESPSSRKDDL
jgi:hypothetical protein